MQQPKSPPHVTLAKLPTPLERLDRLTAEIGGPTIWVKRDDLTEGPAGGNKLRKLEYSIGQAIADGADVLITAGAKQSNHCRQTAFAAARLGLTCHLILAGHQPQSPLDGNLLLDDLMGATITYVTGEEFDDVPAVFDRLSSQYREQGATPFCIPVGASDEIGMWGYIECARELKEDFEKNNIEPTHVIAAVGSGGTHAGLVLGAELAGLDTEILGIAVAHDNTHFESKLDELRGLWTDRYNTGHTTEMPSTRSRILDDYVAPGYGKAYPRVYETIRTVASHAGLVLDPVYGGKAFDAVVQEVEAGRFAESEDIVFLHTGGIYGVFPHRQHFATLTEG